MLLCLLAGRWTYAAQNSPTTGALTGTVKDVSGGVVAHVTVSVRSLTTNQTRSVSSADNGMYGFAGLPVGDYNVRVELPGFSPYVNPGITIALGRETVLDISLAP